MRIVHKNHGGRGRELGLVQRVEAMQSANLLRGIGMRSAAVSVEREVARRSRLGR